MTVPRAQFGSVGGCGEAIGIGVTWLVVSVGGRPLLVLTIRPLTGERGDRYRNMTKK